MRTLQNLDRSGNPVITQVPVEYAGTNHVRVPGAGERIRRYRFGKGWVSKSVPI